MAVSIIYLIFIIFNKKMNIIKDTGFYKIIIFSIGYILFVFSLLFITYENYLWSTLNFITKHIGISMMICICYIYICHGYILGVQIEVVDNKKKLFSDSSFGRFEEQECQKNKGSEQNVNDVKDFGLNDSDTVGPKLDNSESNSAETNEDGLKKIEYNRNKSNNIFKFSKNISLSKNNFETINTVLQIKENNAYNTLMEVVYLYPIYIAFIITWF